MRNLAWIAVLIIFSLAACSGREENVPAPSAPTDDEQARQSLEPIHAEMEIIENMAYHQLCLFYKGKIPEESIMGGDQFTAIMNDATAYGLGNWYFYNGDREKAREIFRSLLKKKSWASFGYIAAEADFAREFKE